ncbi:hypothetical protein CRUP_035979, partial [Coryphaenoides rupestris]
MAREESSECIPSKERTLEVYLVRVDPLLKPTQYKLTVPKMIVTDIYNHRFHRIFATNENLSSIMERDDIYAFELEVNRQEDSDHVVFPVHLREKFKQAGYNHASMPLFASPSSSPRFSRSLPAEDDEEDDRRDTQTTAHHVVNGNASSSIASTSNSEMETDEPDEESSQDQELPSENDNSQSEDSVGGDTELENGVGGGPDKCSSPPPTVPAPGRHRTGLFSIQFNNMGKTDFTLLKDGTRQICFDDGHIRLSDRSYLSLDWEPEMKNKYFDERAAEDFEKHESMEYKPQKKAFFKLKD